MARAAIEKRAAAETRAFELIEARADLNRSNFYSVCVQCEATWIREVTPEQYRAAESCGNDLEGILTIVFDVQREIVAVENLFAFVSEHDPHGLRMGLTRGKGTLH